MCLWVRPSDIQALVASQFIACEIFKVYRHDCEIRPELPEFWTIWTPGWTKPGSGSCSPEGFVLLFPKQAIFCATQCHR